MTPRIFQNYTLQLQYCTLDVQKNLKAVRGSYLPFVIKHALFPLGTTNLLASAPVCEGCVSKRSSNMPISLPHHLGSITLHQARFHVFLIIFLFFGIKMPCHSMHTYASVHVVRPICLKIPSNLLHMELTRTQVHKYDFSNRYGQPWHVDVVQI